MSRTDSLIDLGFDEVFPAGVQPQPTGLGNSATPTSEPPLSRTEKSALEILAAAVLAQKSKADEAESHLADAQRAMNNLSEMRRLRIHNGDIAFPSLETLSDLVEDSTSHESSVAAGAPFGTAPSNIDHTESAPCAGILLEDLLPRQNESSSAPAPSTPSAESAAAAGSDGRTVLTSGRQV